MFFFIVVGRPRRPLCAEPCKATGGGVAFFRGDRREPPASHRAAAKPCRPLVPREADAYK